MTYTVHTSIASHAYNSNRQRKLAPTFYIRCKATKTYFSSSDIGMDMLRPDSQPPTGFKTGQPVL